jgi:hypothetical protein
MILRVASITALVGGMAWAAEPQPPESPGMPGSQAGQVDQTHQIDQARPVDQMHQTRQTGQGGASPGETGLPPGIQEGQETQEGVIDSRADAALRRMSQYVGSLKSFQVDTTTVDEKVTPAGQKIQEVQQSKLTVRRPGELRVDRVSPAGRAVFIDDGRQFGLYNQDKNVYAMAPAPPTIDAAVEDARARLHIDAPGGDLIVPDSYNALIEGVRTGRYIGLEPIDGVMAHHLAFTKANTDWQIWIKDGSEAVPLRFVITSKDMPGQPQFTIQMHDWRPNAPAPASAFMFTPPPGARRVELTGRRVQ